MTFLENDKPLAQSHPTNGMEKVHLPVPSVGRAFEILDLIAHNGEPCSLQMIHTRLGLPKTSAHSILTTLQACGVVVKLQNGTYRLGIRLYTLGMAVRVALENNRDISAHLQRLRDKLGHTVFFSLYDDGDLVVWEKVDGLESVYFKAYAGQRKRLNTSSAGKAIAAYLSDEALDYALSKGMENLTEHSITSREQFLEHLQEIREKGYAIDDEEGERGIFCIGAPVFDRNGQVFGAVSISTLKSRVSTERLDGCVAELVRVAGDLSKVL